MGAFDSIKNKASEALRKNSDKVEKLSDKGLDKASGAADSATGGKHTDKIEKGRNAADERIGNEGNA